MPVDEWKGERGADRGAAVPGSLPALECRDRGSSGGVTNCDIVKSVHGFVS